MAVLHVMVLCYINHLTLLKLFFFYQKFGKVKITNSKCNTIIIHTYTYVSEELQDKFCNGKTPADPSQIDDICRRGKSVIFFRYIDTVYPKFTCIVNSGGLLVIGEIRALYSAAAQRVSHATARCVCPGCPLLCSN